MRCLPIFVACAAAAGASVYGCTFDQGSGPCVGFVPMDADIPIPAETACTIAQEGHASKTTTDLTELTGATCNTICGSPATCSLPADYLAAYLAAQSATAEAGSVSDGASAPPVPPDAGVEAGDATPPADGPQDGSGPDSSTTTTGCPPLAPSAYFHLTCTSACSQ